MKWAIWWGMMVWRGMWPCDVEIRVRWCNVKCGGMMWRGARCRNDNMLHWHSNLTTTAQYFTSNHISGTAHHSTSHHISRISIPPDHTARCQIWCDVPTFCNARCGMLYLIHPVAVMWTGKVQCRIRATSVVWCCDVVQRQVWNVVMRCGMVWCMGNVAARCADARCEMWLWK